jgi:hypothetical protein
MILGSSIWYSRPANRIDPPSAANRFFAHWVASPKGSGIRKPSGVGRTTTGVAYGLPEVRPVWRTIPHSGKTRVPAMRLAIGPNGLAIARIGALRCGRPATNSGVAVVMGPVVFMGQR